MIVEFIGCTGAGKTTLIAEVRNCLAQRAVVVSSFELIADRVGLGYITHPTLQNLIQEVMGLPFFVGMLGKNWKFLGFVLKMLARQGTFGFFTFNYLRSLERTLGVYGLLRQAERRQNKQNEFVFVDEGTIVPAHNIFVYNDVAYSPEEIAQYAAFAPLPDVIVYVRAPVESLVKRTLQRSDPPREMNGQSDAKIEYFVRRADQMFEQLVSTKRIQQRLVRVDNPEMGHGETSIKAEQIAEHLLNLVAENHPIPTRL